ncbi:MAG: hypothetical protein K8U57_27150 [Planctomycetes bacterium]|nr:hypothetical protein [Planctomycetota bacterium]
MGRPASSEDVQAELAWIRDNIRSIYTRLRRAAPRLAVLPRAALLAPLARLSAMWAPDTEHFKNACEYLARVSGSRGVFSHSAVERALSSLSVGMRAEILTAELQRELGRADLLETWEPDAFGAGFVKGYPLGVVTHILAGNVFLGGVVAIAQSLLTRNPCILKLSSEDSGFTHLFLSSLREADPEGVLSESVAVEGWNSSQEEVNAIVRAESDAVVVWGGASAMAAYPQAKCRGRVIHYGPRLGVGVVLDGSNLDATIPALAWDVALWEQRACSSPRVLLVEDADSSGTLPSLVAERLNEDLERVGATLPPRALTLDEKAEVLSFRELAWWSGSAEVHAPLGSMSHTVLVVPAIPADIPLGARTVLVVPFRDAAKLPEVLHPLRDYLQTAVLAAPPERWASTVDRLVESGLTQITAPGSASARVIGLPHEGEYALRRLVKLVSVDLGVGPLTFPDRDAESVAAIARQFTAAQ